MFLDAEASFLGGLHQWDASLWILLYNVAYWRP